MARRNGVGKQKASRSKRGVAGVAGSNAGARRTRGRSKRSLLSKLKFW